MSIDLIKYEKREDLEKVLFAPDFSNSSSVELSKDNYEFIIPQYKKNILKIEKKKENFIEIINNLRNDFKFGNIFIFKDLDTNKICIINNESLDKFDSIKYYDKQSLTELIKSMINNRIKREEIEDIRNEKDYIKKIIEAIAGIKKSFNRNLEEFYEDTDYLVCLNMFKKTDLLNFITEYKIEYKELENILFSERFKRLSIVLKNNIGSNDNIKWFLNWVSLEINTPLDIKTTFVIIGEQGSGKSVLVEEIFKNNIYHFSNVSILDNKTIKDNFNDIYNYKSMVIMNEVSTMDLKENNQITQDLKRLITDGTFINRGMFKSGEEKTKTFNLCFTTNKNTPLQIESGDRRFSVFGRGIKLTDREDFKDLKEDLGGFIEKVKLEIRDFLYLVKCLNYDKTVAIIPIETELKTNIINYSNTKEDLLKSYFNRNDYINLEKLLRGFNEEKEELFFIKLKGMFEIGIFTNEILLDIYCSLFDIVLDDYNRNTIGKKSGTFFSKILKTPEKQQIKINGKNINIRVFSETEIETKKEKLREFLNDKIELVIKDKEENVIKTELINKTNNNDINDLLDIIKEEEEIIVENKNIVKSF